MMFHDKYIHLWRILFVRILSLLVLSASVSANELVLERGRVLGVSGFSEEKSIAFKSMRRGPGIVFEHRLSNLHYKNARFRFSIPISTIAQCNWSIVILSRDNTDEAFVERWVASASELEEEYLWTDEIIGKFIKIQIHVENPDTKPEMILDRIAWAEKPSVPVSIVGQDDRVPIGVFPEEIILLGKSVARIKFIGDDGPIYNCTGFLLSEELMMTNEHCISSDSERQSAIVSFDYDTKLADIVSAKLKALVHKSHPLDYSIVRLNKAFARPLITLTDQDVEPNEKLLVIQHPAGEPKQVSRKDCKVALSSVAGRSGDATDFSHQCDTLGGSSGAPVISLNSRKIVGLHHLGFDEENSKLLNRAVHINKIIDDIPPGVLEKTND